MSLPPIYPINLPPRILIPLRRVESVDADDVCWVCRGNARSCVSVLDLTNMESVHYGIKKVELACGHIFHHNCLNTITRCSRCDHAIPEETRAYVEILTRYLLNTAELCNILENPVRLPDSPTDVIEIKRLLDENAVELASLAERDGLASANARVFRILAERAKGYAEHANNYLNRAINEE